MDLKQYIDSLKLKINVNKERYIDILEMTNDIGRIEYISIMLDRDKKWQDLSGTGYKETLTDEEIEKYLDQGKIKVHNWHDLLKNNRKLLKGKIPGTVYNTGPIAKETLYIKKYLKEITKTGFLTSDSQPGIFIIDNPIFIQLPYLEIANTADKLLKLLQIIYHRYSNILLVNYEITPIDTSYFPNWNDPNKYFSIVLGVVFPDLINTLTPDDIIDIVYLFSDQFFKDIVAICQQINDSIIQKSPTNLLLGASNL